MRILIEFEPAEQPHAGVTVRAFQMDSKGHPLLLADRFFYGTAPGIELPNGATQIRLEDAAHVQAD